MGGESEAWSSEVTTTEVGFGESPTSLACSFAQNGMEAGALGEGLLLARRQDERGALSPSWEGL